MKILPKIFFVIVALALPSTVFAGHGATQILQQVDSEYVCMVNNKLFHNKQIAVEVHGKTYYGCCPMCKAKLEQSAALRTAVDPVSGNDVDKAGAIIGAKENGEVYYFENEDNLKKYSEHKNNHSYDHGKGDHHH